MENKQELLSIGAMLMGGHYRVECYLASGGFGSTYLAQDVSFDEQVVIKEFFLKGVSGRVGDTVTVTLDVNRPLFESQLNKFLKEARRLRKLDHVNVVRVHDLFQENGTAYYVMDYIDGESLTARVKRDGAMSEAEVRQYLPQLLDALETVHNNDILHLDLKPGNIMVDKSGRLRLIDFGASKQTSADGTATTTTGLAYTPGFAAPEQVHGQLDRVGAWTDLYALGATLYYLLSAQTPPDANDIYDDPDEAFRFPSTVSPSMCGFVKWLMQPGYRKRPQSVAAVRQHLPVAAAAAPVIEEATRPAPFATRMAPPTGAAPQYAALHHLYNEEATVVNKSSGLRPVPVVGGKTFTANGVSFTMVPVKGGTFDMGATPEQENPDSDEKPVHSVTLSDYMIGQTQVTQELWQAVMGSNPSNFKGVNLPVENVSWNNCKKFIERLNAYTGLRFRLPTEAEWEFAARGGNNSRHFQYSGSNNVNEVAWNVGNSDRKTHPVGSKAPNELGLYDMSGNVWEWCQDWYKKKYYKQAPLRNPQGPVSVSAHIRVIRGGSWCNSATHSRVGFRGYGYLGGLDSIIGLRLAL